MKERDAKQIISRLRKSIKGMKEIYSESYLAGYIDALDELEEELK